MGAGSSCSSNRIGQDPIQKSNENLLPNQRAVRPLQRLSSSPFQKMAIQNNLTSQRSKTQNFPEPLHIPIGNSPPNMFSSQMQGSTYENTFGS